MKKTLYAAWPVLIFLIIMSCQKNDNTGPSDSEQGVSFALSNNSTLKSTDCFSKPADYANVVISGQTYKIDVFYINDKPYTNTIKLDAGEYVLTEFMLMDDNNTPDNTSDDLLIAATPHQGSEFAQFVAQPLDISFTVEAFKKTELGISVICYQESDYSSFGFIFFEIGQVIVREQFFFGDLCVCRLDDYEGSLYSGQSTGLQYDMPAIAKIEVWRNGVKTSEYSNEAWSGEGQPLTVRYGDVLNHEDNFEFKLFILVRQGTDFNYVHFYTWNFKDDEIIQNGDDGIVDFVLGNCMPEADVVLAPWMNNPPALTYTISNWESPELGAYIDVTLSDIPEGYEFGNGIYPSNCADHSSPIFVGLPYEMNVYSSLYPDQLPVFAQSDKWEKINWLYNHLDWYPGYKWYDIQGFIWLYDDPAWDGTAIGNIPALTDMTKQMKEDADNYGVGYKVPLGGFYVIIFIPPGAGDVPLIQTMIAELNSCE
ncbi:MAG: hypothetical protein P1P88_16240 [Bacteroidales bacterium]|nr:hypothetical protein [Bacteroidales bacterium]